MSLSCPLVLLVFSEQQRRKWRFFRGCIVEFFVKQVRGHGVFFAGVFLEDHFRSFWGVEVVKDVGLIACGRMACRQGAVVCVRAIVFVFLFLSVVYFFSSLSHSFFHVDNEMRNTRCTFALWRILVPCSVICMKWTVQSAWEKWRVRCICPHAVGQLIESKNLINWIFWWGHF